MKPPHRKIVLGIDVKALERSIIATAVLLVTFMPIHEAGHALTCMIEGVPIIDIGIAHTKCDYDRASLAYFASGGLFASGLGLAPLAMKKVRIRTWLAVAFLTVSIFNSINAVIETVGHGGYLYLNTTMNPLFTAAIVMMVFTTWFILAFLLLGKPTPIANNREL